MAAPLKVILLPLIIVILDMVLHSSTGAQLKNSDFRDLPTNFTALNSSSATPILLTNGVNDLPGWSYSGEVWYVGSTHAIKLGKNGRLNQTLRLDDKGYYKFYTVSFRLGAESEECYRDSTALNVSATDSKSGRVYSLKKRFYSGAGQLWESHVHNLGGPRGGGPPYDIIDVVIESVDVIATKTEVSCWPLVDAFAIGSFPTPNFYSDNFLVNRGFEQGPSFINQSSDGILLDDEPNEFESPLQRWSIIGTVKYIDAKHYAVPKGNAAVQLIPSTTSTDMSSPSGIRGEIHRELQKGTEYVLEFLMGDANDSCVADFVVHVQVGENFLQNFTMRSEGNGSHSNFSVTFKAETSGLNPTSIMSFSESRIKDLALCGPVIDNVVLRFANTAAKEASSMRLMSCILYTFCLQAILFLVM